MLQSVVSWLRSGYPEGVPERDYQPLFALLRRQLSADEVGLVTAELLAVGSVGTNEQIRSVIGSVTSVTPQEADIARVSARLAAAGWPLAPISMVDE